MSIRLLCCSGSLESGGSERQLWQLATRLDSVRVAPEVYLLYNRGDYLSKLPPAIPVHAFWSDHAQRNFWWPGQIHRAQVRHLSEVILRRKVDIVYDRTFHMTLLTAAACRRTRTPRISVIVSPPSQDFTRSRERFSWVKKWLLKRAYQDANCTVIAVSESVAQDAVEFYGLKEKLFLTVPSPIDVQAVTAAAQTELPPAMADAAQADLKVVVVGRLSSEKGQRTAIEAMAKIRTDFPHQHVQMFIVGEGPDRAALEVQVQALQLAHDSTGGTQVHFVGHQANPYPWIRHADLLCIPSHYEGLPNVALEALCLKTPVLATNCCGALQELLGADTRGVLTPVGDVQSMAGRLLDRIDHADAWTQRAELGYDWVRAKHGLEAWLNQMQALFEKQVQKARM